MERKKKLNRLVCPGNNVHGTESPLFTCPLFRKCLMKFDWNFAGKKNSFSNKSFLLLNNMFRKNGKKLIAKQNLIECVLPKIEDHMNPFQVEIIFIGFPLHII